MFGDFDDNLALVKRHRLKDEGKSELLVVISGRVGVWLPFCFLDKGSESVELYANEIILVEKLVGKEHTRLDIVNRNDKA